MGRIQVNAIKDLTKVGSVLSKDLREPSIYDLEDLQSPPKLDSKNFSKLRNSQSEIDQLGHIDKDSSPEHSDEENIENKNKKSKN